MISEPADRTRVMEPGFGWMFFAGTILGMAGIMRLFDALWAFRYDGVIPDELEGAVLGTSLTTYGWVWLVIGCVLIVVLVRRVESLAVRALDRDHRRRRAVHLGAVVDAVLPGVVTRVRPDRFSRRATVSRSTAAASPPTTDAAGANRLRPHLRCRPRHRRHK